MSTVSLLSSLKATRQALSTPPAAPLAVAPTPTPTPTPVVIECPTPKPIAYHLIVNRDEFGRISDAIIEPLEKF